MKVQHCKGRGTQCKCRPRVQWLHQCEVVFFRRCGDHTSNASASAKHLVPRARPGPLDHEQKELWRAPTFHKQTGWLCRPEGCEIRVCTAQEIQCCTMNVQHCKSHGALNKNAGSGSSGCISVRSCRSSAAADFRECRASGFASAARTSGPCAIQESWPEAALPRCAGVMVVPSLRRPASRCRGTWRPPAGAQLHCTPV